MVLKVIVYIRIIVYNSYWHWTFQSMPHMICIMENLRPDVPFRLYLTVKHDADVYS